MKGKRDVWVSGKKLTVVGSSDTELYTAVPRCRECSRYKGGEDKIGTCTMGSIMMPVYGGQTCARIDEVPWSLKGGGENPQQLRDAVKTVKDALFDLVERAQKGGVSRWANLGTGLLDLIAEVEKDGKDSGRID